jgi:hypothetical protein
MKRILISMAIVIAGNTSMAQTNLDSVRLELYRVNKVFDSSIYLGFDVGIVYASDTLFGKYDYEEMNGNYVLNNSNVYYKMGDIEYAQNDSFVYNIYHDGKMLTMTRDVTAANSRLFPLKDFLDSTITWYDSLYTITQSESEGLKVIEFSTSDPAMQYNRFAIYYDSISYYPSKFEMSFFESLNNLPDIPDSLQQLIKVRAMKKTLTMTFSNYYNPENLDVFKNGRYVSFDRLRRKYMPSEKFRDYRFISNGVNGDDHDETIELSPPPDEGN